MTSEAIRFMVEHTLKNRPVYNTKAIVITDGAAQDVEHLQTTSDLAKVFFFLLLISLWLSLIYLVIAITLNFII